MKKYLLLIIMIPFFAGSALSDEVKKSDRLLKKTERQANRTEARKMVTRLYEIRDLARKGDLSSVQKKELRDEVKDIKQKLERMEGVYLYLSLTTIIIILLLIILL